MKPAKRGERMHTTAELARKLGWKTHRVRRWLQRTGAGEKRGGNWVTTDSRLRVHFPELLEVLRD